MIYKLLFKSLVLFISIHHSTSGGTTSNDDYYENYYDGASGDSYSDITDSPKNSNTREEHSNSEGLNNRNFQVFCSSEYLTLTVGRSFLPSGLTLHIPNKRDLFSNSCIEHHRNLSTITYRVKRLCRNLVTTTKIGPKLFYRHEALFVRKGNTVTRSNPYAIVYTLAMECEQFGVDTGNGTYIFPPDAVLRPEKRMFEHRISVGSGNTCKRSKCPYSDLCLPDDEVDGYLCVCTSSTNCKLSCPTDYYGCDRQNRTGFHPTLRCISTGWLCDKRFDCTLQDDEASCREIWSVWGSWSPCNSECGSGVQRRHRSCDVSFTRDPQKCKLYEDALGCSRRCTKNQEIEMASRACSGRSCIHVQCDQNHMTVVIPREPGMTATDIRENMLMGGDPTCMPRYNSTHIIFTAQLHKCNTTTTVEGELVTYSNEIIYLPNNGASSIIMRDMAHSYSVKCRFNRRRKVTLRKDAVKKMKNHEVAILSFNENDEAEWQALMGKNNAIEHSASGSGEFDFRMMLFKASNYSQPYQSSDYPLRKQLHEDLYVAIRFYTTATDLTLMIDKCMATPTKSNNRSQYKYDFIKNGCSVDKTVKMYTDDADPKSARFSIETFKFVDSALTDIYFQCDVTVCDVIDKNCRPPCNETHSARSSRKRRFTRSADPAGKPIRSHVIVGPIRIQEIRLEDKAVVDKRNKINRLSVPSKNKGHVTERKQTRTSSISASYLVLAIIGGISCLLIGTVAGVVISQRYRKNESWV